jgi:hypothetical protein
MAYTRATDDPDISRYWMLHHYPAVLRWQQRGGVRHVHTIHGHPIEYNVSADARSIFVRGGHKPLVSPCFVVEIDRADPTSAILQEVERRDGRCFTDEHVDSRNVVRAAAGIARQHGVRTLRLTDWSYILCPEKVHLADLAFLTTGHTWYESALPGLRCVSPEGKRLEEFRELARSNTWRQVGVGLMAVTGVDIEAPGSAMAVLSAMKTDRGFCWFFAEHMADLLRRSGIDSLKGTDWVLEMPVARRETRRRRTRNSRTTRRSAAT